MKNDKFNLQEISDRMEPSQAAFTIHSNKLSKPVSMLVLFYKMPIHVG